MQEIVSHSALVRVGTARCNFMRRSRQVRLWHSGCYLAKHLALQQNARRLDNLEGLYFPGDQAMPKLTRFPLLVSDSHCVPVIDMIVPQHARMPTRKAYLHVKTAPNNILTISAITQVCPTIFLFSAMLIRTSAGPVTLPS
jgi:hypothetical protein